MNQEHELKLTTLDALATGDPSGAIERSEARGQSSLVYSEMLPINTRGDKEALEAAGVRFGEPVDDLFCKAALPDGWTKQATGHSMWSDLLDDKGRKRAEIFYKAAFYDREAFINVVRRYSYRVDPVCGWKDYDREAGEKFEAFITDCGEKLVTLATTDPEPSRDNREVWRTWLDIKNSLSDTAKNWLNENRPDWENVSAYWD